MKLNYNPETGFYFENGDDQINTKINPSAEALHSVQEIHGSELLLTLKNVVIDEIKFFCENAKIEFTDDNETFIVTTLDNL